MLRVLPATLLATALLPAAPGATPDFTSDVKPLLEANCVRCHGAGKDKGSLRLHTREDALKGGDTGPALVPGDVDASELVYRMSLPPEHDEIMPQEAEPLPAADIETISKWVAAGAPWPAGVRLAPTKGTKQNPVTALLPKTAPADAAAAARQIDATLARENKTRHAGVKTPPATPVDDLTFLRRATIDLIGRIPTHEEITRYQKWPANSRREKLLDQLLEHPRFNDRWTVFFSDMLRVRSNAQGGNAFLAYIHQAVEESKPYDELARELIAANGRPSHNPAVGFVLNDDADPMALAGATSQVFLGVRLACAECHDHPFDDWNQRQFYELAAFFGKTKKVESDFANTLYTTEGNQMTVQWPPERDQPESRSPVDPLFPFRLVSFKEKPHHLERLEKRRNTGAVAASDDKPGGLSLDALLDASVDVHKNLPDDLPDVVGEAKRESAALDVESSLYKTSKLRAELADLITDPRNPFFARAFVNRVWFELMGRGFVEPLDNFSSYKDISHPATIELIAREFIASGYDLRTLVKTLALTETYARGHTESELSAPERDAAERAYAISPTRRMLSESLFDSILVAGHLFDKKWPDGANVRTVSRQVRVPIDDEDMQDQSPAPQETAMAPAMMQKRTPAAGYNLEQGIELDFDAALAGTGGEKKDIEAMRAMADQEIEDAKRMAEMRAQQNAARPMRYRLETVEERVDDNPVYTSTMRMATPAPPAHFLRVFGQPSREGLGEFRDHSASLRQQLMMLNGKATHEAARVGSLEKLHALLDGPTVDLGKAVEFAYLETLTRYPSKDEHSDALAILRDAASPLDGMADLRWAILNSHEFRFLP